MNNTLTRDPFGLKVPLKKLIERLATAESLLQIAAGDEAEGVIDAGGNYHLLREAQDALRQSEARFRALIEHSSDVIALLTVDGKITYDSPAVFQVLGYTQSELAGENVFERLHGDDLSRVKIAFTKLLTARGYSFHEQLRFRHQDGSFRWLEGTATNLLHEPAVKAIVLNYRDVTGRVEAEAALRDSELKFRNVVQALPAAIYTCDAHGRITLFNRAAVELWGRKPELDKDRWCGSWKIYDPDGTRIPHDACPMAIAVKDGVSGRNHEIVIERPDGTRRNVVSYPDPIFDSAGKVIGAVKMLIDVTDRKRAEIERERFFTLSPDLLCIVGADGYFQRLNPAFEKTLGYTEAEAHAQPFIEFVHPDDRAATLAVAAQVQGGTPLHNFENRYRCKDGSYRWIDWVATPYPAEGTRYAVGRDITERKLAAEESERQLAELKRWHDVTLGREARVLALKAEVNALLVRQNQPPRYAAPIA
jgi:PAS domain S-box-containing protein